MVPTKCDSLLYRNDCNADSRLSGKLRLSLENDL
jgi:hypothetical protein